MYPSNSIFQFANIPLVKNSTTTVPVNGTILQGQFIYETGSPIFNIYCDNKQIFHSNGLDVGLSNIVPTYKYCREMEIGGVDKTGSVSFIYSYTTSTPIYNVTTIENTTGTTTPQYTQGDFVTQFLLIVMICLTIFGGLYKAINGLKIRYVSK